MTMGRPRTKRKDLPPGLCWRERGGYYYFATRAGKRRFVPIGHVTRELRGLRLAGDLRSLPVRGDKLFHAGREVGYVTSAVKSPTLNANIALGYVRREANQIGNELTLRTAAGESPAKIVELPFVK